MGEGRVDRVYIEDILESINLIERYIENISFEEFSIDFEKQDAVIRRLEIIGEAVKNLSGKLKEENPEIPWRKMAGLRDVVIHQYFGVSYELVWKTVKNDMPVLKNKLERISRI